MCIRDRLDTYWSNISTVDAYYRTNMDFLKKDVRDYFFKQYPDVYSKVEDLPDVYKRQTLRTFCILI